MVHGLSREDGAFIQEITYCHDSKDSICSRGQCIARASILGWEYLRGVAVEYSVHDVREEVESALPTQ